MQTLEEKLQLLPVDLRREVDDFVDFLAHKHNAKLNRSVRKRSDQRRTVTIKALNGKEYVLAPPVDDPSDVTYQVGRETILEAIRGNID